MNLKALCMICAVALFSVALSPRLSAQPVENGNALGADNEEFPELLLPQFNKESLRRGRGIYLQQCASCHAEDELGTARGTDLSRSILLHEDTTSKLVGVYLRAPHGMTSAQVTFPALNDDQVKDVVDYLRAHFTVAARKIFPINPLVGNAAAGASYFSGRGGCSACHSATGDFAGIGSKLDPMLIQQYIISPPRTQELPRVPGQPAPLPPPVASAGSVVPIFKNQIRATVYAHGREPVTGQLVRLSYWNVKIADLKTGQVQSFDRNDGEPRVTLTDPLSGHVAVRNTITDTDMHNLTSYLSSLK